MHEHFSLQNSEALGRAACVQGQEGSTGQFHQCACPLPRITVWVSFVLTIDNVGILCMCFPLSRASLMNMCSRISLSVCLSVLLWLNISCSVCFPKKCRFQTCEIINFFFFTKLTSDVVFKH